MLIFRKVFRQFSESAHRIDRFAYWEACTTSGRNGDHDGSRTSPADEGSRYFTRPSTDDNRKNALVLILGSVNQHGTVGR